MSTKATVWVEFALPEGGSASQKVVTADPYDYARVIVAAREHCKRKGVVVANVQRITQRGSVIFDYVVDTGMRFRR